MKKNWQTLRILVIGAARQGLATARHLSRRGAAVILNDQRQPDQLVDARTALAGLPIEWVLGSHPMDLLDRTDLVCVSGGVPLTLPILVEAVRRGLPLTNDSQIFMDEVTCPVVGITGSAGKTTTTTLVGRMAHLAAGTAHNAWVGGNIGTPLIDQVDEIHSQDRVVLELSSFQLELMHTSPHTAAVLNITPNHLDRHGNMQAYTAAKAHILAHQFPADSAILGREDAGAWGLAGQVQGHLSSFGFHRPSAGQSGTFMEDEFFWFTDGSCDLRLLPASLVKLRGAHNQLNVLAACAIALAAGFPSEVLAEAVQDFNGVPHRLEFVRTCNGAHWYNDSIATAPERSMAAVRAFNEPLVLMLGGRDKNLPWEKLAELIHQRVDHVVIFGEATDKIARAIGPVQSGDRPLTIQKCPGVESAVQAAARVAKPGDVVLFSPGGTSFDEFIDFEERGERFTEWVKTLS